MALKISKRTLQSYREKGIFPFSSVGGKFFYREADVAAYLESKAKPKQGTNSSGKPGSEGVDTAANQNLQKEVPFSASPSGAGIGTATTPRGKPGSEGASTVTNQKPQKL